jgi:hypothetical protein
MEHRGPTKDVMLGDTHARLFLSAAVAGTSVVRASMRSIDCATVIKSGNRRHGDLLDLMSLLVSRSDCEQSSIKGK